MSDNKGQGCGNETHGFPQVPLITKLKGRLGQEKFWDAFWQGIALQLLIGCDAEDV